MANPGFTEAEYFRKMIEYSMRQDDFSRRPVNVHGSYWADYRRTGVLVPIGMRQYHGDWRELSYFGPVFYHWAYKNAEFLRWTLVDESIPLSPPRDDKKALFGMFSGYRRSNVTALLMLQYWPALPELREAMLHDLDWNMRSACAEAIGIMGEHGIPYAKDIRESIPESSKNRYYQSQAVEALGRLKDKGAAPILLELYEEIRDRIDRLSFDEAMEQERDAIYLIRDITEALISLDPKSAREVLAMELANPNPHVGHFTVSAFKLSRLWNDLKLMTASGSALLSYLPKDPGWTHRRSVHCRYEEEEDDD